jgi:hypothetical protein
MLGIYRVAAQLVASRVVLSSTELVRQPVSNRLLEKLGPVCISVRPLQRATNVWNPEIRKQYSRNAVLTSQNAPGPHCRHERLKETIAYITLLHSAYWFLLATWKVFDAECCTASLHLLVTENVANVSKLHLPTRI